MLESVSDEDIDNVVQELHTEIAARLSAAQDAATAEKKKSIASSSTRRQLQLMEDLKLFLRSRVGVSGVLSSEGVRKDVGGAFAPNDNVAGMVPVDAFLWDDDDVDDMVDEGKLKRFTCTTCGSSAGVKEVEFISHSLSLDELIYLFKGLLPAIVPPLPPSYTLVDVGSRLGCVLFGAIYLGGAARAVGIEMNGDLCNLQRDAVSAFQASLSAATSAASAATSQSTESSSSAAAARSSSGPISIVHSNVSEALSTLNAADVVVLHNVFQFFHEPAEARKLWQQVVPAIKSGAVIVASPDLKEQIAAAEMIDAQEFIDCYLESLRLPHVSRKTKQLMTNSEDMQFSLYRRK